MISPLRQIASSPYSSSQKIFGTLFHQINFKNKSKTNYQPAIFSQLQQKIFPVYFGLQTGLPLILALTYPAVKGLSGTASGLLGTFDVVNRWNVLVPVATMFLTGLTNVVYIGPATTKVMIERKHQGKSLQHLLETAQSNSYN